MDSMAYRDHCSVCGQETDFEQYVGCQVCSRREEIKKMEEESRKKKEKRTNETQYDVQKYSYSLLSGTNWEPMIVFLNKTDHPNYIRFGSSSDIEIPLEQLIVSPQKNKYGGLAARNTVGHEDALVFRAMGRKFFLSNIHDLLSALEGTNYIRKDIPHVSSGGGRKKNRRKYIKKYTKRKHTKRRKSKNKSKTKRRH